MCHIPIVTFVAMSFVVCTLDSDSHCAQNGTLVRRITSDVQQIISAKRYFITKCTFRNQIFILFIAILLIIFRSAVTRQFRSRFPLMNIGTRTQFSWKQGRKLELRVIELLALERASRHRAATLGQHEKTVCSLSVVRINNIRVHHFAAGVCSRTSMYLIHKWACMQAHC